MYLEKPCCQPLSRRFHTHRNRPREPANLTLAVTNRTLRAIDTGAVPVRFAFRARRCRHTLGCWPSRFRRDLSVALAYRLIRYAFAFRIARPLSCHCHWVPSILHTQAKFRTETALSQSSPKRLCHRSSPIIFIRSPDSPVASITSTRACWI